MFNREEINDLYTNFRGEVIAAGAVDNGFDRDRVLLKRREGKSRETDKEIADIEYKEDYEGDGSNILLIKTNRRGMYDNLPEALFHSGLGLKHYNKENLLETIRRQDKEEFYVRRFFSLYETEIDRSRIEISRIEFEYDRPNRHRTYVNTLGQFWSVIYQMDTRAAILFSRTIPYIAEIRNRYANISQALSLIMGYSINIKPFRREIKVKMDTPRMGMMKLGINSTLKGKQYEKYASVEINMPADAIKDLLPQARKRKIIEALLEFFMPEDIKTEIKLRPAPTVYTYKLGDSILGVNARLK